MSVSVGAGVSAGQLGVDEHAAEHAAMWSHTAAQLASAPTVDDVAAGDSAIFYDVADPTKTYKMNAGHTAFIEVGGGLPNIAAAVNFTKRPIIGFAGDSIPNGFAGLSQNSSPFFWALFRDYPADVILDGRTYANGGYNVAVGGQTTSQFLTDQPAQIAARTPDILIVDGGTNNSMSAAADVVAALSDLKTLINGALAAGVQLVIYLPVTPKSNVTLTATQVKVFNELNRAMQNYAEATDGVAYVDPIAALLDPASAAYAPIGNSSGGAGSMTQDGLHPSTLSSRAMAAEYLPYLQRLARKRKLRAINQGDVWDATNNVRGNLLGTMGTMRGTNGTLNSVANAGIAASWAVTTSNGFTVTPSIVTGVENAHAPAGYPMQRFELSGTLSANGTCVMTATKFNAAQFTGLPKYGFECLVRLDAPVNLGSVTATLNLTGGSSVSSTVGGNSVVVAANDIPSGVAEYLFLFSPADLQSVAGNNQAQLIITFSARNGVTLSGAVEVGFAGIFQPTV